MADDDDAPSSTAQAVPNATPNDDNKVPDVVGQVPATVLDETVVENGTHVGAQVDAQVDAQPTIVQGEESSKVVAVATPVVSTLAAKQSAEGSETPASPPKSPPKTRSQQSATRKKKKKSLWASLAGKLIPCISTNKSHPPEEPERQSPSLDSSSTDNIDQAKLKAKTNVVSLEEKNKPLDQKTTTPEPSTSTQGAVPVTTTTITPDVQPPSIQTDLRPPTPITADIVVPPSPKIHLLPPEVTAGVTSGAVQAPGSTGLEEDDSRAESDDGDGGAESEQGQANGGDGTVGEGTVQDEDDEDRLIMQGGIGIPIVDGVPRPLLPPVAPEHKGRKCLVLDLDETLLHSSFKLIPQCDYVVPVEIEWQWHNVYVIKRPGVDAFLEEMGKIFEIVVFTASLSKYADPVLDKLDVHKVVSHRLFRESCYNHKGNYVKDLSQLGRPMTETIILDNSPASYIFHPNNAVPVSSWFNDPHDTELTDLCPFLTDLRTVDDIRGVLDGGL